MEIPLQDGLYYVALLFLCIVVNAFCVAGKFSFAQLRREYIEDLIREGDESAREMLKLYDEPTVFLGMAQIGMVFSGIAAGVVFLQLFRDSYDRLQVFIGNIWLIAGMEVCLLLAVCAVLWVFGELIPKSVGLQRPEQVLRIVGPVLHGCSNLFSPFIKAGSKVGQFILRRQGLDMTNEIDMSHSEDEIRMLVTASHKGGKIDKIESELIDNVFEFADLLAKEIMVPRQDIVCLTVGNHMNQNLNTIRQSRHTRYPLCEDDKDHIIGLVHIKDFLDLYIHRRGNLRLINRPILMIPEIMEVSKLLQLMRAQRTYLAIVVDEYGSTVGLIGLEDILEELVGNIRNEHTAEKEEIQPLPDGGYEFDGTVLLDDVEELLRIPVEDDVDTDTIGGYVFNLLGQAPSIRDEVRIGLYRFTVLETQGFRISRLKAVPLAENGELAKDEEGERDGET